MPTVESGQDWSTDVMPCPECGDPCIRAHNQQDADELVLFDFEPLGVGVVLRYHENDNLPTQAEKHDVYAVHECDG